MNNPKLILIILFVFFMAKSGLSQCPSGYEERTLDWDLATFTTGELNPVNYAIGGNSVTIDFDGTYDSNYPRLSTTYNHNGGYGDDDNLSITAYNSNTNSSLVKYTFKEPIKNLRFSIYDVDASDVTTITSASNFTLTSVRTNPDHDITVESTVSPYQKSGRGNGSNDDDSGGSIDVQFIEDVTEFTIQLSANSRIGLTSLIACTLDEVPASFSDTNLINFNWANVDYQTGTPPVAQTFPVANPNSNTPVDVSFVWSGNTNQITTATNDPIVGSLSEQGGLVETDSGLEIAVDPTNSSSTVTLNVTFSEPVTDLRFSLYDIDNAAGTTLATETVDIIDQVSLSGSPMIETDSEGSSFGIVGSNTLRGLPRTSFNGSNDNDESRGTANIFYPGETTSFTITYEDISGAANPAVRLIELSNLLFNASTEPDPEPLPCSNISGNLSEDNGAPVVGMEVQFIQDLNGNGLIDFNETILGTAFTDANGNYSYSNPTGPFTIADDFNGSVFSGTNNNSGNIPWDEDDWSQSNGSNSGIAIGTGSGDNFGDRKHIFIQDATNITRDFSLSGASTASIEFKFDTADALDANDDSFFVEILNGTTNRVFTYNHPGSVGDGTAGTNVRTVNINISQFAGQSDLTFRFLSGTDNSSERVWLDDLVITYESKNNIIVKPLNDTYKTIKPNQSQLADVENEMCSNINFTFLSCQDSSEVVDLELGTATPNSSFTSGDYSVTNSVHFAGTVTSVDGTFGTGTPNFNMRMPSGQTDGNNDATGSSLPAMLTLRNYVQSSYEFSDPFNFDEDFTILDLDSETPGSGNNYIDAVALVIELEDGTIIQPNLSLSTGTILKSEIIDVTNSATGSSIPLISSFPDGIQVAYMNREDLQIPSTDIRATVKYELNGLSVKRLDIVYFNAAKAGGTGNQNILVPNVLSGTSCLDPIETFAENDINQTPVNVSVSGNLLTNDTDPSRNPQIVTSITLPNSTVVPIPENGSTGQQTISGIGTITVSSDGSYTFTPATDFTGQVPTIGYDIEDSTGATDSATLDIDVLTEDNQNENDPPVAHDDTNTTDQGVTVDGNLIDSNDYDPDTAQGNLIVTEIEVPDGMGGTTIVTVDPVNGSGAQLISGIGTIEVQPDGTYEFIPDPNFIGDVPPIGYTIADPEGGEDSAFLNINIRADENGDINNTYGNDDSNVGTKGVQQTGNVLDNDFDPEVHPVTVTEGTTSTGNKITPGVLIGLPSMGTITINANGTYVYDPDPEFIGTEVVEYTVCDNQTPSACETVTIYLTTLPNVVLLPVELISFTADAQGVDAVLDWSTATELHNEKFELEYSLDGMNFEKFAEVAGQGTITETTEYSYTHIGIGSTGAEQVFYRLQQVDFDGTTNFSDVRVVVFASVNELVAYPVPAQRGEQVVVTSTEVLGNYKVYNMSGVVEIVGTNVKAKSVSISTDNLSLGKYILLFEIGKQVRFVIE